VLDLEVLGNMVGADIRQYFTYLPGLPSLLALPGHRYIHYTLAGTDYRVIAQRAKEVLGLTASDTTIHQLCCGNFEPPRRPTSVHFPLLTFLRCVFVSLLVRALLTVLKYQF